MKSSLARTRSARPLRRARPVAAAIALSAAGALALGPSAGAVTGPARHLAAATPARVTAAVSSDPIVGMAPSGPAGYWLVNSTGTVFSFGDAADHGSAAGLRLASPIVGMAATPGGGGYWLVAADGGVFSFGDAAFYGSTGDLHLDAPIVGMASTPDGHGYWLVAADGGVFSFGDAAFHGSTGDLHLDAPMVGMAATPGGGGYWLVAADGGVFSFGDAAFYGSTGDLRLDAPMVGMASSPDGHGYWLVGSDGGVFSFGDAPFAGAAVSFDRSVGGRSIGIDGVDGGYWVATDVGDVDSLGAPAAPEPTQTVYTPPQVSSGADALPAETMPTTNTLPTASFVTACFTYPIDVAACNSAALSDIDSARAGEGYGPLQLPADYDSLPLASQVLAVANAERTSRGLPALAENATLDALAEAGATANGGVGTDPVGPSGYGWGSNIAWGDPTALAADFSWMYDDGPGGENVDCTASGQPGCWGHRRNILAPWGGQSGAAVYDDNSTINIAELFVENY